VRPKLTFDMGLAVATPDTNSPYIQRFSHSFGFPGMGNCISCIHFQGRQLGYWDIRAESDPSRQLSLHNGPALLLCAAE